MENKLLILGRDNFYEIDAYDNQPNELYLVENIKRKFNDFKILLNEESDSIDYKIVLKNPVIKTTYKKIHTDNILGTKQVEREVSVSYELDIINKKDSSLVYNNSFNKKQKDNFDLEKLSFVEDNRYSFSRSTLPEEDSLNQYIFPAIIIAASAVAIILFFVIRSK